MSSESPEGPIPTSEPGDQAAIPPRGLDALIAAALAAPRDPDEPGWTVKRVAVVSTLGMLLIAIGALGAAGALALLRGPGSGPIPVADRALIANPGTEIAPGSATVAAPRPTGLVAPPAATGSGGTASGTSAARAGASSAAGPSPGGATRTIPAEPRTCTVSQRTAGHRLRWNLVAVTSVPATRWRAWEVVFDLPPGDVVVRLWDGTFRQVGRQVRLNLGRQRIQAGGTRSFAFQVAGGDTAAVTGVVLNGRPCVTAAAR